MATIVVAETEFWPPGVEFAAAMSRRGHTTVRLLADDETDEYQRRWWKCASRTLAGAVTPDGALTGLGRRLLEDLDPVDWQVAEPIQMWLADHGHEQMLARKRSAHLAPDHVLNKGRLTAYLESVGIGVPPTWFDYRDVPDSLPGPFVFKPREGGGGFGVHLLDDLDEAPAYVDRYAGSPYLIQPYYPGPALDAAGVARDGRVVQMMTYRNRIDPARPYAAAYGITTTDDAELSDYTRAVVEALGINGPFALDAVRGSGGRPLIIDLNLRVWGCWTACQALGMDVLGSYEYALGLAEAPEPFRSSPGRYAPLLRRPPLGVSRPGERLAWLIAEFGEIRRRRPWLGPQWARAVARDSLGWAVGGAALPSHEP